MPKDRVFHDKDLTLTLLHSERPKLYAILAFPSAIGLKTSQCSRSIFDNCGTIFSCPEKCVVTRHQKCPTEAVQLRGHNICFMQI